ncbi:unnamed protein product [Dovyalis caffra]|uniref:Uncharacterized protein n=1 Tax=Dovyalis caffra TaxID=77055 RepID=A0AAV1RDV5_9ROSI|nr:unnamed protein product [Dovyalis caffra]
MGKLSASSKKKNGIIKLKIVAKKLHKSLLLMGKKTASSYRNECEEINDSTFVPKDVKEGHFAVIADEQAAEEYGFDHEGALTIPCQPSQLEMILEEQREETGDEASAVGVSWSSISKTMVQSY